MKLDEQLGKQVQSDMGKLRAILRAFDGLPRRLDDHEERHVAAFSDMLSRMVSGDLVRLTEKQRGYLNGVYQRMLPEIQKLSANANSVAPVRSITPDVLRVLPKKPPMRITRT